ncbi:MAG: M48 family metallopeptidase [Devosiaceae bacterium]|nr:M48 family metallopeptidase [Devosiaceae bacterium MH13]
MFRFSRFVASAFLSACLILSALPIGSAEAQGRISVLRDAEVEALVASYTAPILRAAGLGGGSVQIVIVNDRDFNAFVADGRRIFINVGAIMQSDTPNEIIGVIAHETGHLAGAHLSRLRQQIARSQLISAASILAGAIAVAAAVGSGDGQAAMAGQGTAAGGTELANRTLLAYQREEELAADRAAISYLNATGQSGEGMLRVFERFADQTMFTGRFVDPYVRSHPMARDRINQIDRLVRASPHFGRRDPAALQLQHDLARARLTAVIDGTRTVARRYPSSDRSLPARYARAIVEGQTGSPRDAVRAFDQLISEQPSNPFFWEMRGNVYFEAGNPAEAARSWARALELAPNSAILRVYYGAALVETGDNGVLDTAIGQLERALAVDPGISFGFRFLGQAYARQGNTPMAQLASGLEAFARGNVAGAKGFAQRAQQGLPRGSTGWLRAQDIIEYDAR